MIKTNHACGTNIIVKDKSLIDTYQINQKLTKWLKMNFADAHGEMQYYNIEPKILVEKYLEDEGDEFLIDYKFWCFDGEVVFLYIKQNYIDNNGDLKYNLFSFDCDFNKVDMITTYDRNYNQRKRPKSLNDMIQYSSQLSKGFPFVRVDFYEINGEPIFGEMTLTPTAGNNYYLVQDAQKKLGELMNLHLITTMKKLF